MSFFWRTAAAVAALAAPPMLSQPPVLAATVAEVDPSTQFQVFQGWGTSLAWWAHVVGGYPEPARSDYIEKTFDLKKGLGLNVVRYNIGGGENPKYLAPNKQFIEYRAAVPGFQPEPGKWDWSRDANQRWVLHAAIRKGANELEAFSNSPPHWMTISGSVTGNHNAADNLDPRYDAAFAEYLATVVAQFRDKWKVNFRLLEPFNEPISSWWKFGNRQEGCVIGSAHQNTLIKLTAAALAKRNLPTRISASDETSIDDANKTFPFYDAQSLRHLAQINVHSYGGGDRTKLWNSANAAGKPIWLSEYGDGDASGLTMSRRILEDMDGLHPTSWAYWQVVDNAPGWGFLRNPLKDQVTTAYEVNKKFWVMAQYSRFIRPGFRLIAIGDPNSLAALDARSGTLVIVTTNAKDEPEPATFDLSRFTRLGARAAVHRTSPTQDLARLPDAAIVRGRFADTLPPRSVTTFVVSGARYSGPMGIDYRAYFGLRNEASRLPASEDGSRWAFVGVGGGWHKIVNRASGLVLDVARSEKSSGAEVLLYSYNGGANQQWRLQRAANGSWTIANRNSGLLLSESRGAGAPASGLVQRSPDSGAAQRWRLEAS